MARHVLLAGVLALACESASALPPTPAPATAEAPSWAAVPGMETCAVERWTGATAAYATPWQPCGDGCRTRAAVPPALSDYVAERAGSAAQVVEDRVFLRTSLIGPDTRYEIVDALDLGEPVLVLRMARECHVSGAKAHAALLIEAFRAPPAHLVATFAPGSGALDVHDPIAVQLPLSGWFASGPTWGVADAGGLRRAADGELRTIATSTDWIASPRATDEAVAWIDWGRRPAAIAQWPSALAAAQDGDVAAFARVGSELAWLEVTGASAHVGIYASARVRWPEGELDLSGRIASTSAIELDAHDVGVTTPGDGASIPAAFLRVDRTTATVVATPPPPSRHWELAGAADGRWLLQQIDTDRPHRLEAWVEHRRG